MDSTTTEFATNAWHSLHFTVLLVLDKLHYGLETITFVSCNIFAYASFPVQ